MAITAGDYLLWKLLGERRCLPKLPSVVEIGEANWYGDVPLETLKHDYGIAPISDNLFELAKRFYAAMLGYSSLIAIDPAGQETALKYDLNHPVSQALPQFDVLINTGTIEHVFNQKQAWQTCHEITKPGGLMVHVAPLAGWLDHGFYTFQPTLLNDLAAVNGYELLTVVFSQDFQPSETTLQAVTRGTEPYTGNCMLHWAWRKGPRNTIFQVPQQGYYAGTLSEDEAKNWSKR